MPEHGGQAPLLYSLELYDQLKLELPQFIETWQLKVPSRDGKTLHCFPLPYVKADCLGIIG